MTETLQTFITNRHGLKIAVQVNQPDQTKGLIFLAHGWKGSRASTTIRTLSEQTRKLGLTTVTYDCTHSTGQSDGQVPQSTITSFVHDLEDVVSWARTQEWFQSPYSLVGSSMGGISVLEHARRHTKDIKAIAPLATLVSGALSIEARQRHDSQSLTVWQETGFEAQTHFNGTDMIPWSHMEDRLLYNALDYASELTMPVFLCVGTEDTSCPPDHQALLFEALGSTDKTFHQIDGAPHNMQDPVHYQKRAELFAEWLTRVA